MDLPHILKLPVELRNIIYSYALDEQEWLPPDFKQAKSLSFSQNRLGQRHFRNTTNDFLYQRQEAFLKSVARDTHKPQLTCVHPPPQVNNQMRL